jgi:hypothetical protein
MTGPDANLSGAMAGSIAPDPETALRYLASAAVQEAEEMAASWNGARWSRTCRCGTSRRRSEILVAGSRPASRSMRARSDRATGDHPNQPDVALRRLVHLDQGEAGEDPDPNRRAHAWCWCGCGRDADGRHERGPAWCDRTLGCAALWALVHGRGGAESRDPGSFRGAAADLPRAVSQAVHMIMTADHLVGDHAGRRAGYGRRFPHPPRRRRSR